MLAPPPYEGLPLTDCSKIALKAVICFFKTIASNFGIELSNRLINISEVWTKIENTVKGQIAIIILHQIDKMLIKNITNGATIQLRLSANPNTLICLKTFPCSSYFTFASGGYIITMSPMAIGIEVVPTWNRLSTPGMPG